MPIHNAEIADLFERYATLLEIEGANPFRIRAYRNAARTIQGLPQGIAELVAAGRDLDELPAVGKDLAQKLEEIVRTGHLAVLEELETRLPETLVDLTALPGLGPKRVRTLFESLGISILDELKDAVQAGRVGKLAGFSPKTEQKLLAAIAQREAMIRRMTLFDAEQIAEPLLAYLRGVDGVAQAVVAGSFRRRRETVGDLDILVTCRPGAKVVERFVAYDEVAEVLSKGRTRSTVRLRGGLQVDLRVLAEASYGAALHYFTGSKAHNIAVRKMAVERGLKLNEYGVFRGRRRLGGKTEQEVYEAVGLPYIEPELREDTGEIAAALAGRLPRLITQGDLRGDLHAHTEATDGRDSLEAMAAAAAAQGYAYLAITDHTRHVTIAHGQDARRLARQLEAIDRLNERLKGIRLLKSAEVDILEDGTLDLPASSLAALDLTVCAVHYKFDLSAGKQTERIIRAMDNPRFNILAHPTGRLLGERAAYAVDMERVMTAALERGCCLEINAQPSRLDLADLHIRMAKAMGLKLAISTDAHSAETLGYIRYGIDQARRGWLEAGDVLNTLSWPELRKALKRR